MAAKKASAPAKAAPAKAVAKKAAPKKAAPKKAAAVAPWLDVFGDPKLSSPPTPGAPGHVPPGGDLDLNIGWSRFEHLLVFVAEAILGLAGVKFRRYGIPGQAQQGIDLSGRRADGAYVVVQCKDYKQFTVASLNAAVKRFVEGERPFGATHLIIAVSCKASSTQLENELAAWPRMTSCTPKAGTTFFSGLGVRISSSAGTGTTSCMATWEDPTRSMGAKVMMSCSAETGATSSTTARGQTISSALPETTPSLS